MTQRAGVRPDARFFVNREPDSLPRRHTLYAGQRRACRGVGVDQRLLVERAKQGDHDAFAQLVDASVVRLDAAARLILRNARRAPRDGQITPASIAQRDADRDHGRRARTAGRGSRRAGVMTDMDRVDRRLPGLLEELAAPRTPDYLDDLHTQLAAARQR